MNDLVSLKPRIQYGCLCFDTVDTTPGALSWAAPPEPVDSYTDWLRAQYKHHRDIPVYLGMAARLKFTHGIPVDVTGPHTTELIATMQAVVKPH